MPKKNSAKHEFTRPEETLIATALMESALFQLEGLDPALHRVARTAWDSILEELGPVPSANKPDDIRRVLSYESADFHSLSDRTSLRREVRAKYHRS